MRRIATIVVTVAVVATACSGETETETFASTPEGTVASDRDQDLVEAITNGNPDGRFDDETANCIVQGIVDEFGTDELAELGVTPENPDLEAGRVFATPDASRRVVDVAMECIDIEAALVSFLPADVNLLDETIACVADEMQSDTFRDLLANVVVAGGEPTDILSDAAAQLPIANLLLSCLTPEELLQYGDVLN